MNNHKNEIIINKLALNSLFKNINKEKIISKEYLSNYMVRTYKKNEVIAFEGEECDYLGIIIDGKVEISRILPSGKSIVLKRMEENSVFGEAIIFAKESKFPATIIASENCTIINMKRKEILKLCREDNIFLENFMSTLSEKILMLNKKIKNISFGTVKEKVANYIIEQYKNNYSTNIFLTKTKEEISAELGIPRPSFSRELIKLKQLGYIEYNRKNIKIIDFEGLENLLYE